MSGDERVTLLAVQRALTEEQFQSFKFLLAERVPLGELLPATRPELCHLLLQRFPGQALRVTADLLRQIARHDLLCQFHLPGTEEEKEVTATSLAPPGRAEENVARSGVPPPPVPAAPPRRLTEKELMQLAQKLGKEWQEVGIVCLGLERSRLEQIREDNPRSAVLQSFEMLREWRRRQKDAGTARRLRACLAPANVDPELLDLLQSFQED
ncbi:CRADD protein, partial [Geococcyx californianus]|nr:CRADD protein [Geococcyx californianus]